jgi:tricorn protease-like protein
MAGIPEQPDVEHDMQYMRIVLHSGRIVEGWRQRSAPLLGQNFISLKSVVRVLDDTGRATVSTPMDSFIPVSKIARFELPEGGPGDDAGPAGSVIGQEPRDGVIVEQQGRDDGGHQKADDGASAWEARDAGGERQARDDAGEPPARDDAGAREPERTPAHEVDRASLETAEGRDRVTAVVVSAALVALAALAGYGLAQVTKERSEFAGLRGGGRIASGGGATGAASLRRVAFISDRTGNPEIYVVGAQGGRAVPITSNGRENSRPVWSPAGTELAYGTELDGELDIYVTEVDGNEQRILTHNGADDWAPDWAPDGNEIVFASDLDGNFEIYSISAEGGEATQLTDLGATSILPAWSPRGDRIAFSSDVDGDFEIYAMNADGTGQVERLTRNESDDRAPQWSPDGQRLAFAGDAGGSSDIYVLALRSGQISRITQDPHEDRSPDWSPDGRALVFASNRAGSFQLYVVRADGRGAPRRFERSGANDTHPAAEPPVRALTP